MYSTDLYFFSGASPRLGGVLVVIKYVQIHRILSLTVEAVEF
ncbi:unnamed protein product [Brassica rapa subsp. trilocularis]